jgi:hypothetical protein
MIDLPDFWRDDIDMTVQWGYGRWSDYETTLLVLDPKIICCTPEIGELIKSAKDITRFPLLDTVKSKRLWPDILRHLAVEQTDSDRSIGFDDAATMRRATLQGIGVGLVSVIDAEEDLKSGALVAPLGTDVLTNMNEDEVPGFYLVVPPIVLILNNGIYGTIRVHQERNYPTRVSGTTIENPDFVGLAKSYGFHAERVSATGDFALAFVRAQASPTGAVLDLAISPEALTPRQTLSQMRDAALASLKA